MGQRSPWRARNWAQALGAGAMLVLMLGGCGGEPDAEESRAALTASQDRAESRLQEAVDVLTGAGFAVADAEGRWQMCGTDPRQAMEYTAGGALTGGDGDPAARVVAATKSLQGDGWRVESASDTPRPYANLVDGDGEAQVRLSVKESKLQPGTLSLGVTGACLEASDDDTGERLGQKFSPLGD